MLAFFRRALGSWIVLALLALVVLAFVVTGVGSPIGLGGGGPAGDSVASIGSRQVRSSDVAQRIQNQYNQARQQQPDLTLPAFLTLAGGINAVVDSYISAQMLDVWATGQGIVVSPKLVDAQIAAIPAFKGINGEYDERQMQGILAQQRMTLAGLRDSLRGDLIRRELITPIGAAAAPSMGLVTPYAGLLVAKREGQIGLIPYKPEAVAAPSQADLDGWYKGHLGRYSLPERRVIRYALVNLDSVAAPAPSDAAVEAKYKADAAKYSASEKRTLQQVVLSDEAAARALAAKIAAGAPFAQAAAGAGFDAAGISLGTLAKADLATATSPAIADAAFTAAKGATVGPIRSPLGWHVLHVEAIATTPARSLAEARGEILGALIKQAQADALGKTLQKIEDALGDGGSFDDIVKANGLTVVTTPPVTAAGAVPTDPAYQPDPTLAPLIKAGFLASPEDAPSLETIGADGRSALMKLSGVTPAAPLPFAQVAGRVRTDLVLLRAAEAAKTVTMAIKAKVDAGRPLTAALAEAGYPAPQSISISQIELRQAGQQIPPALRALFQMAPGKTALAAGPKGLFLVRLDRIANPAPALLPVLAQQLRGELGRAAGDEYVEQFANAARRDLTIRKNPTAIDALGKQLTGQAPAGQ